MVKEYMEAAMAKAEFERVDDCDEFFGEIRVCPGVWARGKTLDDCRRSLEEVLEGWILLGVRFGDPIPEVEGVRIEVPEIIPTR